MTFLMVRYSINHQTSVNTNHQTSVNLGRRWWWASGWGAAKSGPSYWQYPKWRDPRLTARVALLQPGRAAGATSARVGNPPMAWWRWR